MLDFGAVARLPEGLPRPLSVMTRLAWRTGRTTWSRCCAARGSRAGDGRRPEPTSSRYLAPFAEPLRTETFHFTRRWLQSQAERVGDMRSSTFDIGRRLNLPAQYLLCIG